MSVPHVDTRHINGKKELLFGPFAGFSTKFLNKQLVWLQVDTDRQRMAPCCMQANNVPINQVPHSAGTAVTGKIV